MEVTWLFQLLVTLITVLFFINYLRKVRRSQSPADKILPPSPPFSLPFLGHLHLLREPLLHRTFWSLSQRLGPVFSLQLGSRFVLVVSSPSAVEECFTTNDVVLANRPQFIMGKDLAYDYSSVITAPYGDHWRNLRRICSIEIFSSTRLNASSNTRNDETQFLLRRLRRTSSGSGLFSRVELRPMFTELTFNIVIRMLAGKRYYGENLSCVEEAKEFRELIGEIVEYGGATNPADFLPVLRWVDYQGIAKRSERLGRKTDAFLQGLIDEHRRKKGSPEFENTMISHLLSLQESSPDYYTDLIIKGLVLIMLVAGTDTTGITIEWAMSNLLNHPYVLQKAKTELDTYVGADHLINESDLLNLTYLNAIISETLRLYPASPLLVPHESSDECKIGGYHIPRGTMVLVNAWGIHRDPKVWDDPASFRPERFEDGQGDAHYKLLPFGAGRRACPGMALGIRTVGLVLGSLIQCFEWKRAGEEEIDMGEGKGITMPKAHPLIAMCKARDVLDKFF
ncbi:cytochrome P450 81E8-like [Carica papaya]|uniref:cytochrome P450 81E8-like n=1 Tax=Carica papaya TaxID=3649 RepID=UPI000B8CD57B|nr:cytochrome P450 81E8-like [Carica papaya]